MANTNPYPGKAARLATARAELAHLCRVRARLVHTVVDAEGAGQPWRVTLAGAALDAITDACDAASAEVARIATGW